MDKNNMDFDYKDNQFTSYLKLGIVAMVAMTPLITIQLLGFKSVVQRKVVEKHRLKTIISSEDEQIINFM